MSDDMRNWIRTTVGEIALLVNGRAFKPSEWRAQGTPIVRIQNLNNADSTFNYFDGPLAESHAIVPGELLFAWSGTPGTSFGAHIWRGPPAALNQHIFKVTVDETSVDRQFLAAAINASMSRLVASAQGGAGLKHLTKRTFEETPIMLPPLAEQKRIARLVREHEDRTDRVKRLLAVAADTAGALRTALLAEAYDPEAAEDPAVGPAWVSVAEVATRIDYGSSSKSRPEGAIPVLRMGNVKIGEILWNDLVFTSDEAEIAKYQLAPGDLLFVRTNGSPRLVGQTAVYDGSRPAIFAGYLIRVSCSDRMLPRYLSHCLNGPAGRAYCEAVRTVSAGQSNVNASKLAAFRLPCPALAEQQRIVEKIDAGLSKLTQVESRIAAMIGQLPVLESELLVAAVAGRMGTMSEEDDWTEAPRKPTAPERKRTSRLATQAQNDTAMLPSIRDVLLSVGEAVDAQDLAERVGILPDADTDAVARFYRELAALDREGRLHRLVRLDEQGRKIGEALSLVER